ncbi:hypothetical protein BASA81_010374 [Batrachochytrium salamandrivorans]|nr:hypothetical protein BASA81_010374 [Batrachochytrium salamandrivorans]
MEPLLVNEEVTRAFLAKLHSSNNTSNDNYYLQISTRAKYGGINQVLFRKVVKLDRVIEELHRATPLRGFYFDGQHIPHHSLAVYLTPEPRDTDKACRQVCSAFILKQGQEDFKLASLYLSECQKSPSQRRILDIDIDVKEKYLPMRNLLVLELNVQVAFTIESRGGYHLLCYDLPPKAAKLVHDASKRWGDIDLLKNSLIPLPGTIQGGVEVQWLE